MLDEKNTIERQCQAPVSIFFAAAAVAAAFFEILSISPTVFHSLR